MNRREFLRVAALLGAGFSTRIVRGQTFEAPACLPNCLSMELAPSKAQRELLYVPIVLK